MPCCLFKNVIQDITTVKKKDIYSELVIKDAIIWIDTWEKFITHHLPEDERGMFLSRQTAESVRLTSKSILAPKASPSIPSRTSELTMLTDIRQKFNLLYPSEALLGLLIFVEEWVNICMKQTISEDLYFVITNKVLMDARLSEKQVGCNVSEHKTSLTAKVTHFFVVYHIYFFTREVNMTRASRLRTKSITKKAHLQ
ncbi:hypothetical protein CHUAL_007235 [Chamberlinius hualienensis]